MRDLSTLGASRVDLVVIGGGIHGLFAAYDAAARGLTVTLVEQNDFGSGLSFNHQRTIHGGLRALQSGHVRKCRAQIRERRTWARIAPHLLRPLPFLIGTYRFSKRSRTVLRAGFALYDRLGRSRNAGIPPELHLPAARLESRAATSRLFRGIDPRGLTGGAVWYDYQVVHPDRLNWTVALAARAAGASIYNYVEAVAPLRENGRISGVRVRDRVGNREHDVLAATTLIAAGSGLRPLLDAFGTTGAPPFVRAMNLLFDRPASDIALVAPGKSGRMLTAVPWAGRVLVGTHQSQSPVPGPESAAPVAAIGEMVDDVATAYPAWQLKSADVRLVQHGLTPAVVGARGVDLLPEALLLDHGGLGAAGLFSLIGVKLTTARAAAERAVDAVCRGRRQPCRPCATSTVALPYAGIADVEARLVETLRELGLELDADVMAHLMSWYATEAPAVVRFSAAHGLLGRLSAGHPVLAGEIAYAAAASDAVSLDDAVYRRTPLGSTGPPDAQTLEQAARAMEAIARRTP